MCKGEKDGKRFLGDNEIISDEIIRMNESAATTRAARGNRFMTSPTPHPVTWFFASW